MSLLPEEVRGWLTEAQAARLDAAARRLPAGGRIAEIGSFHGRSTIVLARAAPGDAEIVAIDPHLGSDYVVRDTGADMSRGDADHEAFWKNLERAGVRHRVHYVRAGSETGEALAAAGEALDLLYVDGVHRYAHALADIRRFGPLVRRGGTMLVHDAFSSFGVTFALLRGVTFARDWRYAGRSGSLAEYVRAPRSASSVLGQLAALPWFARNLAIKALLLARLERVAVALGHRRGDPAPY